MKTTITALLALSLICGFAATGSAAGHTAYDLGCWEVLERWAVDPDSMPLDRVEECKGIKGIVDVPAVVPFAGPADDQVEAADPCAGPDAAGSVHCWGPWAALAPAAGAELGPPMLIPAEEYDLRPELAREFDPDVSSCEPGKSCGFATIVDGASTEAPSSETTLAEFDLATDGTAFVVAPGTSDEIDSVTGMTTDFSPRPDGYEEMQALGIDGDLASILVARVLRSNDGQLTAGADAWIDGNVATRAAKSGYFAWGIAMTRPDLDFLRTNGVSATFRGPMSVDNNTFATVAATFGPEASWTGTWTNPGYSFDAGGTFIGVDMLSDASQFSSNVGADSFVRGALLGQRDAKSITHIISVDLAGVGRIKDVGLLRE